MDKTETELIKAAHKAGVAESAAQSIARVLNEDGFILVVKKPEPKINKNELKSGPKKETESSE